MPVVAPYLPVRDGQLATWLANFSSLISAAPATYGLLAGDASVIAADNASYQAAYALVTSATTKTADTVSAKNTVKASILPTIRLYAQQISNNAGVTSANKIALGLNPKTTTPTPITAPTTAPVLTAQSTSTAGTIFRYRDATASPSVKAKPFGVIGLQMFGQTAATPVTDPTLLPLITVGTKSPLTVALGSGAAGKIGYFAARWITRKGLVGPWSSIVAYPVAG